MSRSIIILFALACFFSISGMSSGQSMQTVTSAAPPATPEASANKPVVLPATVEESSKHLGCVTLFVRNVIEAGREWLELKAQMAGCSRGHLHLHTYVNSLGIFGEVSLYQDGEVNDCANSTECSVIWTPRIYLNEIGVYEAIAHGWNDTTGGSTYVSIEYLH